MTHKYVIVRNLFLAITLATIACSCAHQNSTTKGLVLQLGATSVSSQEIDDLIKSSLAWKYPAGQINEGYKIYPVEHGANRWLFCKVYNAPRGLNMFNLYCYEWQNRGTWVLRAYVPMNLHYFPYADSQELEFAKDGDYLNVLFRKIVIFSTK